MGNIPFRLQRTDQSIESEERVTDDIAECKLYLELTRIGVDNPYDKWKALSGHDQHMYREDFLKTLL